MKHRAIIRVLAALLISAVPAARGDDGPATRNVVLVTTDGLRWQEVFRGAEPALLNAEDGGVKDVDALRRDFGGDDPEARREALMPFLWDVVAQQGQLLGNRDAGSVARVANGKNFSYPGYSELLTGAPDDRIASNDRFENPNRNVLGWLHGRPEFRGRVAVFGSWDRFPDILRARASGLPVNAGWQTIEGNALSSNERRLNRRMSQAPHTWADCRDDAFTFRAALEHLRRAAPRVLYIALGDTDEYAHAGRYDLYLRAAHRVDEDLKILWDELQSTPSYRGTTTLIVTTDHGRGDPPKAWRDHGAAVAGSDAIWLAVLGPDTPPLGERRDTEPVTQGQVAATVARFLGLDYPAAEPRATPPIDAVFAHADGPDAPRSARGSEPGTLSVP